MYKLGHDSSDMPVTNFELQVFDPDHHANIRLRLCITILQKKKIKTDSRVNKNGPNPPIGSMDRHGSWKNHTLSACRCVITLLGADSRLLILPNHERCVISIL